VKQMAESHDRSSRKEAKRKAEAEVGRVAEVADTKAYARRIISLFNARSKQGRRPAFFPTIQCCIVAEETKLETVCPGCGTITHSHIDKDKYHPLATVAMLLSKIHCSRCGVRAPLPRIRAIGSWSNDVGNPFETWGVLHSIRNK
jgi:hypothetical protein